MLSLSGLVPLGSPHPVAAPSAAGEGRFADACRLACWAAAYVVAAVVVTRPVDDADVWWHLRAGEWVVEHQGVPQTDPFSQYGQGKRWLAYSWLFEVLIYELRAALGLFGVVLYRVVLSFAVVAAIHRLIVKRGPRFLPAAVLFGAAVITLVPLLAERPWLFTILFTTLTLGAALDLRDGRARWTVWLLPLAFALWANLHIQFVYGLLVLGLACAAPLIDRLLGARPGGGAAVLGSRDWWKLV
ncbi:MAG TPA: hypothetical protein VFA26_15130, partial [Gemmataceae bacterium]|nr:hypothetical protein [Gemmataceae bacterium]